jgi:hypothetical protein
MRERPSGARCAVTSPRANPQWRDVAAVEECLVVFQGPQEYVTPSWYATKRETDRVGSDASESDIDQALALVATAVGKLGVCLETDRRGVQKRQGERTAERLGYRRARCRYSRA